MKNSIKNPRNTLFLLTIVNLILLFISIKLFFEVNSLFQKKPELIQKTYSHNISETKIKFKNSVKENFSIGTSEIQLIKKLAEHGFKPGWSYDNQHEAVFVSSNVVCFSVWSIRWKVDKHGKVTEINGQYRDGCL